jgi:hypothetical protein
VRMNSTLRGITLAILILLPGTATAVLDVKDLNIPTDRLPSWYDPTPIEQKYFMAKSWPEYDVTCTSAPCPSGRSPFTASAAIAGCQAVTPTTANRIDCMADRAPDNIVLFVPNGTYTTTSALTIQSGNLVIRGESMAGTRLLRRTGGRNGALGCDVNSAGATVLSVCSEHHNNQPAVTWTGGYSEGSTTLSVADTATFTPGAWAAATMSNSTACELSDVVASSQRQMFFHMAKVTARSAGSGAGTVTLDRPLTFDYDRPGCSGFTLRRMNPVTNFGVETLTIGTDLSLPMCTEAIQGSGCGSQSRYAHIATENAAESWFVGVQLERAFKDVAHLEYSARLWFQGGRMTEVGLNVVDLGAGYMHRSVTDIVHENQICDNTKVCYQNQQGAQSTVFAYSYFSNANVQTDKLCQGISTPCTHEKSIFNHGYYARHMLAEGNDLDGRITFYDVWWSRNGPYHTAYRNRNRRDGSAYNDCGGPNHGLIAFDAASDNNRPAAYGNLIGNTALGYMGRPSNGKDCATINPFYGFNRHMSHLWMEKNAFRIGHRKSNGGACSVGEDWCAFQAIDIGVRTNNATTSCGTGEGDACPGSNVNRSDPDPSWAGETYPTSFYRSSAPSWWCQEACAWDQSGIGAFGDDFGATLCKLPAQIRHEGGTCTPLAGGGGGGGTPTRPSAPVLFN